MSVGSLIAERQAVLVDRLRAVESLRETGETTVFDPEYDRLTDELRWLMAITAEYTELIRTR